MEGKQIKTIYIGLLALLFLLLGACTESMPDLPVTTEGESVPVKFSVNLPAYKSATRAIDENAINNLYLLLFDENGNFIKRAQATLVGQSGNTGNFTVTLPASTEKRYIHFIANYNWTGFNDAAALHKNEGELIPPLFAENSSLNMWARVELANGINADCFTAPIELIRNMAKITVVNNATNLTNVEFAVYKAPTRGSIAPFNTTDYTFTAGTLTEPNGVSYTRNETFTAISEPQYVYERQNRFSGADYTCVIIKGTYNGATCYYKLDMINADKIRYDIERNYHYRITINGVGKRGHATVQEALDGAAANNAALDPVIEEYPMISDGISKLEVDKTLHVFVNDESILQASFKYIPDILTGTMDNSEVTVTLHEEDPTAPVVVDGTFTVNYPVGGITADIHNVPTDNSIRKASIVIQKGELSRTIHLELRPAFTFTPVLINGWDPDTITGPQGSDAQLTFVIPETFPDALLPYPVRIYTKTLYPTSSGMQIGVEGNQEFYYTYNVTAKGLQTVNFKTNLFGTEEVVYIRGDLFKTGSAGYNVNILFGHLSYITVYNDTLAVKRSDTNGLRATSGFINVTETDGVYMWRHPASLGDDEPVTVSFTKPLNNFTSCVYTNDITVNGLEVDPDIYLTHTSSIITGMITYGSSQTPVPTGSITTISAGGTAEIISNGKYRYIYPVTASPPDSTKVTSLVKINDHVYEEYETTVPFSDAVVGVPINLGTRTKIIIYGDVVYGWGTLVPTGVAANRYRAKINNVIVPDIFNVYADGKYQLTLPGNTAETDNITLGFRWGAWYEATKTLTELREDSEMDLSL